MRSTSVSFAILALTLLLARHGAAQTAANNVTVQSKPAPNDPPNFRYALHVQYTSSCSADQQDQIHLTVRNIYGLSDRIRLWDNDAFHNWDNEVTYWFGDDAAKSADWIRSTLPSNTLFVGISTDSALRQCSQNDRSVEIRQNWVDQYLGVHQLWA